MEVYEKIKFMRQLKGKSQEFMAEQLGMSVNGYSNIECGKTDLQISRIIDISRVLEIDLLELVSFGEKNVFYQNGTNNVGQYVFFSDMHCKFQLEKMQLIAEQKDKEIEHLKKQISQLEEINRLLNNK
jgi:transcriptional regulator with XRE-family HTH domain